MQDRVGTLGKPGEGGFVVQASGDPGDAVARRLITPGERADAVAAGEGVIDGRLADEAGGTGKGEGQGQSSTIWLRWTKAARGA